MHILSKKLVGLSSEKILKLDLLGLNLAFLIAIS